MTHGKLQWLRRATAALSLGVTLSLMAPPSLMAAGAPAKKKPVKNLQLNNMVTLISLAAIIKLQTAASVALIKKILEGEKRSAKPDIASNKVPTINPACTALVR